MLVQVAVLLTYFLTQLEHTPEHFPSAIPAPIVTDVTVSVWPSLLASAHGPASRPDCGDGELRAPWDFTCGGFGVRSCISPERNQFRGYLGNHISCVNCGYKLVGELCGDLFSGAFFFLFLPSTCTKLKNKQVLLFTPSVLEFAFLLWGPALCHLLLESSPHMGAGYISCLLHPRWLLKGSSGSPDLRETLSAKASFEADLLGFAVLFCFWLPKFFYFDFYLLAYILEVHVYIF